jgi:tripartite-type tricarboxylate transporter receptor subunit TctC
MHARTLTRRACAAATLGMIAAAGRAGAQQETLRWLIGYAPGGGTDTATRLLAAEAEPWLGRTVVVENRPGAATIVAAEHVAKAPPDGQTIMSVDMGTIVYNPALYRRLPYDPARDFRPVVAIGRFDFLLVANADIPARSVQELVALAKARPGTLAFASPGVGSPHHLGMEQFRRRAGIEVLHVPYRGAAPAVADLVAGTAQAMVLDYATAAAQLPGGKLRPLAATTARRIPSLPDLHTMAEAGFPENETYSWLGVVAPAATPETAVARLNEALTAALDREGVRRRLGELGVEPIGGPAERLRELVEREAAARVPLIRELGLSLEF